MGTITNNPQAVYNGMISSIRNMFLLSSIAIVVIGLSNKFYKYKYIIKLLASILFILAMYIGIKTINDYNYYLLKNKNNLPDYIPYDNWVSWKYIVYIYIFVLIILLLIILLKNIKY